MPIYKDVTSSLNTPIPPFSSVVPNSPYQMFLAGEGLVTPHRVVLTGNGATSAPIFRVTQGIIVRKVLGFVSNVVSSAVFQACSFDAFDTAVTVPITSAAGTDCSGAESGAMILRNNTAASTVVFLNANQVRISEIIANELGAPFVLNADNTTATSIRFNFTGNALTNLTVDFFLQWIPTYGSASVVAI